MANEDAKRDGNFVTSTLLVGSTGETFNWEGDETTGRAYVDIAGGAGTVTSVSVVTANGFAGTVANATTTPAITLSTTVNAPILAGNGTAIAAATTTGSGSTAVLATAPTFPTNITVGAAAGATGDILLKGTTSGTVTLTVADAAGTWQLTLPTTDGDNGQVLTTDGTGVTSWTTPGGGGTIGGTIADTQVAYGSGADTIQGSANLTFDGTNLTIAGDASVGDDLLLTSSGSVINWNAGDVTLTHSANTLTLAGGSLRFDNNIFALFKATTDNNPGIIFTDTSNVFNLQTESLNYVMRLQASDIQLRAGNGTATYAVLKTTNIATSDKTFEFPNTSGTLMINPMTTGGDIIYGGASGLPTRLANGTAGFVLTSAGTTLAPTWSAPAAATTITVANEATDTTCFPVFVTAATGDLGPKSNTGLTFNSNTALLTATLLAGTTSVTSATIRASSNDSGSLGASGTAFSDLFLASGAVIDFAAGNSVITHSSAVLTVSTGDLRVTTAGTNSASVVTNAGTQTLTNKRNQPRTASSTTDANLTPDLSSANVYFRTTQTGSLSINAPTGTPVIGEVITIYVDSAGAQTLTINSTYKAFGAAFPASTTAGKTFMLQAQYNGTDWKTTWANAV